MDLSPSPAALFLLLLCFVHLLLLRVLLIIVPTTARCRLVPDSSLLQLRSDDVACPGQRLEILQTARRVAGSSMGGEFGEYCAIAYYSYMRTQQGLYASFPDSPFIARSSVRNLS